MSSIRTLCCQWSYGTAGISARRKGKLPFHLFTPHLQYGLHSQFVNLDWMQVFWPEPFVYIHPLPQKKGDCVTW
jgi:anaerobic selenocysteine-containing dehydrogenase